MVSILFVDPVNDPARAPAAVASLLAALDGLGCPLLARCESPQLVHLAARLAPQMVVCGWPVLGDALCGLLAD
ncbi:MAG: hypothetical protein Q8L92_16775, partial [Rubrivivax sp.]|nr:hypothetical protein [Rubrivivax sp.]